MIDEKQSRLYNIAIVVALLAAMALSYFIYMSNAAPESTPGENQAAQQIENTVDWRSTTGIASIHRATTKDENGFFVFAETAEHYICADGSLQDTESENCIVGLLGNFQLKTSELENGDYGVKFTTLGRDESHWIHLGKHGDVIQISVTDVKENMR